MLAIAPAFPLPNTYTHTHTPGPRARSLPPPPPIRFNSQGTRTREMRSLVRTECEYVRAWGGTVPAEDKADLTYKQGLSSMALLSPPPSLSSLGLRTVNAHATVPQASSLIAIQTKTNMQSSLHSPQTRSKSRAWYRTMQCINIMHRLVRTLSHTIEEAYLPH